MKKDSFAQRITSGALNRFKLLVANPYAPLGISGFDIKKLKHLSPGPERHISIRNHPLHYIAPQELVHGLKEIFVEEIYKQTFGPKPYILDCGANIGLSVIYLKQIAPDAEIEAFEPDQQNFTLLSKNVKAFGLEQVTLHQKAIWNANEKLQFKSEGTMSSRMATAEENTHSFTEVTAVRLKDFLTRRVDFLKIDIEGAEYQVLKDIAAELQVVQNMFLEYHGSFAQNKELIEMFGWLNQAGFNIYIKEAAQVYDKPFYSQKRSTDTWDVQLNIFCSRT